MRARIPVRFGVLAFVFLCAVAACTGDDEIYAVPKDAGPAPEGAASSSSSSGGASSSSGGTGTPDGSPANDAATDGPGSDGGDGGDASSDGSVVDGGADSGPVTCSLVPCAGNGACTAVGCGSCNLGLGFCKL
jgi:hypothetical protein